MSPVALDRPAGDRGDLVEAERDHARAARGPVMHSDMLPHARPATYRRRIENRIRARNIRLP
jgi:hypothetical protein